MENSVIEETSAGVKKPGTRKVWPQRLCCRCRPLQQQHRSNDWLQTVAPAEVPVDVRHACRLRRESEDQGAPSRHGDTCCLWWFQNVQLTSFLVQRARWSFCCWDSNLWSSTTPTCIHGGPTSSAGFWPSRLWCRFQSPWPSKWPSRKGASGRSAGLHLYFSP